MLDRLQKPFLKVDTGEAYQPIRLNYEVFNKEELIQALNKLTCLHKNTAPNSWDWHWKEECADLHFDSSDTFIRNPDRPVRLGTLSIQQDRFYINLPSFKRACIAAAFFHEHFSVGSPLIRIHCADFINKVFSLDERLPRGLNDIFKDEELEAVLKQRADDYKRVQELCENAESAEEATAILKEYTLAEARKRFPYAERYAFDWEQKASVEGVFLNFYVYLRGREMVAIKRWAGEMNYTLVNVADDVVHQIFGAMDIDIIE